MWSANGRKQRFLQSLNGQMLSLVQSVNGQMRSENTVIRSESGKCIEKVRFS